MTALGFLQRSFLLSHLGLEREMFVRTLGWQAKGAVFLALVPLLATAFRPSSLERFTRFMIVGFALVQAIVALLSNGYLYKEFAQPAMLMVRDASGIYQAPRVGGTLGIFTFGALMLLAWPLVLFRRPSYYRARPNAFGFAIGCTVLFIVFAFHTSVRSIILGFFLQLLAVGALALWGRRHDRSLARIALGLGLLALALALLVSPALARRTTSLAVGIDQSILNRAGYFQFALQMIALRPLSGWGASMYAKFFEALGALPTTTYHPVDAHSSVLFWLICYGLAGCALVLVALVFPSPRTTFALIPRPYMVSFAGLVPVLISDNITASFLQIPMMLTLMTATVVARNWAHGRLLEKRPPRALAFLSPALFALYVLGVLMPPPSLGKWLERVLYRAAQRVTDHISLELRVEGSDFTIAYEPKRPHPSYLASLGVLASYTREAPDELVPVHEFRLSEVAATTRSLELPATDLLATAAMRPNDLPTFWLRQNANARLLTLHCEHSLGHDQFGQASLPVENTSCRTCATFDLSPKNSPEWELKTYIEPTSATTHQLAHLWDNLLASTDTVAQALRRGMANNIDELGFLRHLPRGPHLYHVSFYTGPIREELLYCDQNPGASWRLAALYTSWSVLPLVPRPDSAANRQFAELAFRVWSFFEVFDISALPERQYRTLPLLWIIDSWKASRELD